MSDQTSPTVAESLGTALRQRRRALGLTQAEVAELASTTQRFVSTVETGKPTVRLDKLVEVARTLGMELVLIPHDHVPQVRDLLEGPDAP